MFILIFFMISYNGITYNPLIDSIISEVDSVEMMKWIREISGEDSIYFLEESTLINTRWYDTYDMSKAEDYLLDYFKSLDLDAYKQVYWTIHWTWPFETLFWSGRYNDYSVFNDTMIYLVSTDNLLDYSWNGGYGWGSGYGWNLLQKFPSSTDGVLSPAPGTLYVYSGSGEVYFSSNTGYSFERRDSLLPSSIQDMQFIMGKKGWMISNMGVIGITSDAGITWDTVNTGVPITRDIFFIDSLNGWFCGYFGKIYHSLDGGYTWIEQTPPIYKNLQGIYFINPDTGWICGDDGAVFRTTNCGDEWNSISISTDEDFREVYFKTFDEGWVGGTNGSLYYTDNGGANWEEIEMATMTFKYINEVDDKIYFGGERDLIILSNNNYIDMKSYLPNAVCNIIAIQPGVVHPDTTVIIGGHCDAVSENNYTRAPGANNNGSGVGAVKEAAKLFREYNFKYTIEYMFWGSEEMGSYGSQYYVEKALSKNKPIKGVIDVNEIGYDTIGTYDLHIMTDSNGTDFAHIAKDIISLYSLPLTFAHLESTNYWPPSDSRKFWINGYSGIFFENNDQSPNDWTIYDTVEEINVDFYYNYTKLALAELAYIAGFVGTGIPEDIQVPITLKLDNSIINDSQFSFSVTCSGNIPVKISLYDITGRMVYRVFKGRINGSEQFNVNKDFRAGVYFLKVDSDVGVFSKKLVILGS